MAKIRSLTPADVPRCAQLNEAAGWNQTRQDWLRLLDLQPDGCFGIECGGGLAATTTAVCYGEELAWIGMVLTAPEFRNRGLARSLLEHALEFLARRSIRWIKLDATGMGIGLYRQFGFEDECTIERWLRPAGAAPLSLDAAGTSPFHLDAALDGDAFGADRTTLLERLAVVESASIHDEGYAMGRPGWQAAYFGPCVARSTATARVLLQWFLSRHPREPVFWDLMPSNAEAVCLAGEFGFQRARSLTRMARPGTAGAPLRSNGSKVFAIAGFEYG